MEGFLIVIVEGMDWKGKRGGGGGDEGKVGGGEGEEFGEKRE